MASAIIELLQFLHDRSPQVRQIALSNLLPQTVKDSPFRHTLFLSGLSGGGLQKKPEPEVIRDLKLLCRDQLATSHDAFRALVNLSDSPLLVPYLTEPSFFTFLVSYIINPESTLADLASMLLSNLTTSPAACSILINLKIPVVIDSSLSAGLFASESRSATCLVPQPFPSTAPRDLHALPLLLDAFVQGALAPSAGDGSEQKRKSSLHFLASVFANITGSSAGRRFFLDPISQNTLVENSPLEYPLAKLLPFTEHPDIIRRGGVASAIKNCAFEKKAHRALLSPESEIVTAPFSNISAPGLGILASILLPLAGPEELDLDEMEKLPESLQLLPQGKKREIDENIRITHVETLILLATTRFGREIQRENGVYYIIREAHLAEKTEKIIEHLEKLVNYLQREEEAEVEEVNETQEVTGTNAATPIVDKDVTLDEDDEDSRIEEI